MPRQKSLLARVGAALLFNTPLAALLAPSGASATPQDFPDQQVMEIASGGAAEGIYIVTANTENSVDGCGARFFLAAGNPLLNQNMALALSALYAHSPVHLQVDGCEGTGAMRLKSVRLLR